MTTPTRLVKLRGSEELSRVQDNVAKLAEPTVRALQGTPIMGAPPPAWVAMPFLADFAQTAGQAAPAYHKDALGYVHSKGSATTAAGQAAGTAIVGPLPMGFRPSETQRLSVRGDAGAVQAVVVSPTGTIALDVVLGAGGTVDLAFSFLAEQ